MVSQMNLKYNKKGISFEKGDTCVVIEKPIGKFNI